MENNWFGKKRELSSEQAIQWLEAMVSEGYLGAAEPPPEEQLNLFGRLVCHARGSDLSFIAGLSAAGLRVGARLDAAAFLANAPRLAAMARQMQPVVLYAAGQDLHGSGFGFQAAVPPDLAGTFCLQAADAQEALDLGLIAHKIAELALIPGVVAIDNGLSQELSLPGREVLAAFLGEPDDMIASPTPAQEMLFGKQRRRIPAWFNFDLPASLGMAKDAKGLALEAAARQRFFSSHLPALVRQAMAESEQLIGRHYAPVHAFRSEDAEYVLITQGAAFSAAKAAAEVLRAEGIRAGCLNLCLLRPFPEEEVVALLAGKKAALLLLPAAGNGDSYLAQAMKAALAGLPGAPAFAFGYYGGALAVEEALLALRQMMPGKTSAAFRLPRWGRTAAAPKPEQAGSLRQRFFLGLGFSRAAVDAPQAQLLIQEIRRRYPEIDNEGLDAPLLAGSAVGKGLPALPQLIRRYRDLGPPYSRLSRFYHDTASFFCSGQQSAPAASPFEALAAAPAASALFAVQEMQREALPVFNPVSCTGCGACVLACPHAALPPLAIGVEGLIKGAMSIAASRGMPLAQFTPLAKNLARLAGAAIAAAGGQVAKAADFLPDAFEQLLGQLQPAAEKESLLRREWAVILELVGEFPLAVTEQFFTRAERLEKGSGTFFAVAINPSACTGCGRCAEACPEGAIEMQPAAALLLEELQASYDLWEQLPDSPAAVVESLVQEEAYNPYAALMLSRHYYQSIAGGSLSEEGVSAKGAFHLLAAQAESLLQPRQAKQARELEELASQLSDNIHQQLSAAMPREGFLPLQEALNEAGGNKLPLDELIAKLGQREHLELVDTASLLRKSALLQDLKALRWAIAEGPTGTARARFGLLLPAGLWPWAERYPYNVFLHPAWLDSTGGSAALLSGLMQGHLRHTLDNIRLLRRARLEVKDKYRPELHGPQIAALRWEGLDEAEKALLPPLLLLAGPGWLEHNQGAALEALLTLPWPVKILLVDKPGEGATLKSWLLNSAVSQNAVIGQGSLAAARELYGALRQALGGTQPALFRLLLCEPGEEAAVEAAAAQWREWQEIAARMARASMAPKDGETVEDNEFYIQKINTLQAEYEAKLQEQESLWLEKTRIKLRERLLALAQRKT